MKRIYHTGPNITSRNRAVLSGGSFCFPMPYGNENDEDTHGKDREAHTAIDRP